MAFSFMSIDGFSETLDWPPPLIFPLHTVLREIEELILISLLSASE